MKKDEIIYYLHEQQPYFYNTFGIKFIGLFGSYARGNETKDSDIDILYNIEKGKKLSMFKYLKIVSQLEEQFHKKIDLVRFNIINPKIKSRINQDLIFII